MCAYVMYIFFGSIYVCVYVYMYICKYVCMHVCMYGCMYVCIITMLVLIKCNQNVMGNNNMPLIIL